MLGVYRIGKIRQAHYRKGRSIKGISRDLSVSQATIQKVFAFKGD